MELSKLIGKQILSPTGDLLGYALTAYLSYDNMKLSSLVCADEEEEKFYLPARTLLAVDDAIIAGRARISAPSGFPCPIGMSAYSSRGEFLGRVCDYLFGDELLPVFVFMKEGVRTTAPADCVTVGESLIVYPDAESKPHATRKKRCVTVKKAPDQTKAPQTETNAEGESAEPEPDPDAPAESAATEEAETAIDENSAFRLNLLGKMVKRNVYDAQGSPIAMAGEFVTPALLLRARKHNRLLQLTVNTLTKIW